MRDEAAELDEQTAVTTTPAAIGPLGARRSTSADAAWRAEQLRILALSPRDRVLLSLSLGSDTDALLALPRSTRPPVPPSDPRGR